MGGCDDVGLVIVLRGDVIFLCYLSVYNHIKPASQLVHGSDYMIFKVQLSVILAPTEVGGRGKLPTDLRTWGLT